MKQLALIALFLISNIIAAQTDAEPVLIGSLGWSSDGQYIAVGTTAGVHIHASDDLSRIRVLDESFNVSSMAWSNTDLRIAYHAFATRGVVIWDLASNERSEIQTNEDSAHIAWAPSDKFIAVLEYGPKINISSIETGVVENTIRLHQFQGFGTPFIEWSPNERYIVYGAIANGFAVFNAYTGWLVDFVWHNKLTNPLRWSPDGNLLVAAGEGLRIWQINDWQHPHDRAVKLVGNVIYERTDGGAPSWHPDSNKIAFVDTVYSKQDPLDFSGSRAVIWDLVTDTDTELPGVFITEIPNPWDAIKWSPEGSKLASISSDGRIVIWDTSMHKMVAEYAGYRSILDYYAENP